VLAPRGRRLDQTIDEYLLRAAARRKQLTAVVTAVAPLSMDQQTRLRAVLARIYGKAVLLQVVVDPEVIGGIRIRVGDEVVDGTVLRRLDEARRHMAGG
jgi:F-type H+-transporting ATPase subunit delta